MEIEFQGTLDKATYFRAFRQASRSGWKNRIYRLLVAAFVVLAIGAVIYGIYTGEVSWSRIARTIIGVSTLGYFLARPYWNQYQSISNLWKEGIAQLPRKGLITSQGITHQFATTTLFTAWEKYAKVTKAQDLITLQTPDGALTIMPRSFFRRDEDWKLFQHWIDQYVKEPK